MLERAKIEVAEVEEGLLEEEVESGWISANPSSQAVLLSLKKQNRFEKNNNYNGFILRRNFEDAKKDEFIFFLRELEKNIKNIPSGTRLSLAIFSPPHWITVDLLIENQKINSFVLDAAALKQGIEIHADLNKIFPSGKHYIFKGDKTKDGHQRIIQTQDTGCRVFVVEHINQLSTIPSHQLYHELSELADDKGNVIPGKFIDKEFALTKIFKSMQTYTGLVSFPSAVLETKINSKGQTLKAYIDSNVVKKYIKNKKTGKLEEKWINETIQKKNKKYISKKHLYFNNLPPDIRLKIMMHRQGFTFLRNPCLFRLSSALASNAKNQNFNQFIEQFCDKLEKNAPTKRRGIFIFSSGLHVKKLNETIKLLRSLSKNKNLAACKNQLLLELATFFEYLDRNKSSRTKNVLIKTIDDCLFLLSGLEKKPLVK